jgi:hypothetical protein
MKVLLLTFCALLAAFPADSRAKARCHSECFQCSVRCKQRASNVESCRQTCLELKRACCGSCGHGPGPQTTCDCT